MFLKVSPMKGVMRFGEKGQVSSKIYKTIRDLIISWRSGIQIGVTSRIVTDSPCISRIDAEEVHS